MKFKLTTQQYILGLVKPKADIFFLFFLLLISLIPLYAHMHLVEDDFSGIQYLADCFYSGHGYCFNRISNYVNLESVSGLTGRPPLVSLLLALAYKVSGHNILAIYITYSLPRLLILPVFYLLARQYFRPIAAYLCATLILFFPFFETYAASTLKADVFVVLFSVVSVLFSILWSRTHRQAYLIFAGFFIAANILSKETAVGFSLPLFIILLVKILRTKKHIIANIFYLLLPIIIFLGPFIVFSLISTGRILPSIYAQSRDLSTFPQNIYTYVMSLYYYSGVMFGLSKFITLNSLFKLALLTFGIGFLLKNRKFEPVFPVFGLLIGISVHNLRVVQGDIIGNREILHRIAPVVPFLALYMASSLQVMSEYIQLKFKKGFQNNLHIVLLVVLNLSFINYYFKAPFALDYTDEEFYINAKSVFQDKTQIPLTEYSKIEGKLVASNYQANNFLTSHFRKYKTSAFPQYYKEILIFTVFSPLMLALILKLDLERISKKRS